MIPSIATISESQRGVQHGFNSLDIITPFGPSGLALGPRIRWLVVVRTPEEIKGTEYINCGGYQSTRLGTSTNNDRGISFNWSICENSQKVSV
jgi:hypothetical protein